MGLTGDKTDVFDNNWVSRFNKKIDNIVDYTDIKELTSKLLDLKKILKINVNINFEKKSKELRKLLMKVNKKHIEFKENINTRRRQEDERRRQEDEIDLFLLKKEFEVKYLISYEESSKL